MISYAQNFEDVMLYRVFRDRKSGFYIDVGAMDPTLHSVTKFFYDQGWRGINVEPNEWFYSKLKAERERDINLNCALGDKEEEREFHVFKEHGISTFDEASRDHFLSLGFNSEQRTIGVRTLKSICQQYADRPIDFLKVDCEGWEKVVLAGADWENFRPLIVVVEATLPGTTTPAWEDWEPLLTGNGYEMVYFDGLNRFYLRQDSPGLRVHFSAPPNVFDQFKLHAIEVADQALEALRLDRDALALRVPELEMDLKHSQEKVEELQGQLAGESQRAAGLEKERGDLKQALASESQRATGLEKERGDLKQALLKARLWVGQLSQDVAAEKRRNAG